MKILKTLPLMFAALAISGAASAAIVNNATVTILGTSSAAFGGYGAANALDTASNRYLTDFAGAGTGVGTHLDFMFAAPQTFSSIVYTDRTSSGGGNGSNTRGTTDFVTMYKYDFATDALFTNIVGTFTSQILTTPVAPASYLNFQHTDMINNFTSQYLRFTVLSANGANPGAADFQFSNNVPEPGSIALLGLGLLGFAAARRKFSK